MEAIACDVLVIGSGAAGLTTAITAHHFGADVLVVEKASTFGGTTARSGGWLWVPGNPLASRSGRRRPAAGCKNLHPARGGKPFRRSARERFSRQCRRNDRLSRDELRGEVQLRQELSRLSSRSS